MGIGSRFVELSHVVEDGMPPFPGLPSPRIGPILDHEASRPRYRGEAEFYLGKVEMAGNTGTYVDAPFHRYRDGVDLAGLPLERLADLPGVVLDCSGQAERALTVDWSGRDVHGAAVLVRTGWDRRWGMPAYWEPGPYLDEATVRRLLDAAPALVGVDFWNVDDTDDPKRPAHSLLLGAGIPIVEHLCNLRAVPETGFRFFAPPVPLRGGASFPVRAFAIVDG